jgi:hypothetical protein
MLYSIDVWYRCGQIGFLLNCFVINDLYIVNESNTHKSRGPGGSMKVIHIQVGARVAQRVRSLDLTTHTSLSPIRGEFAPVNNISAISWRLVLVVEEAGVPGENHRPWASN